MRISKHKLARTRSLVAGTLLVVLGGVNASAQCPPNHWYCPEWPANCILVGCQKTCGDCTYTCAFAQGRDCPPLIMCLSC